MAPAPAHYKSYWSDQQNGNVSWGREGAQKGLNASSGAQFVTLSSLPPCSLCAILAAYYWKGSKLTMNKPKILKDLEKLALHFVLGEDVKRQNLLLENRCCYLKSSPLRTRKNSARILRTTSTSPVDRQHRGVFAAHICLNEKITTRRKKRTFQRKYSK